MISEKKQNLVESIHIHNKATNQDNFFKLLPINSEIPILLILFLYESIKLIFNVILPFLTFALLRKLAKNIQIYQIHFN